jgi:ParB family chromosome partitioning protein
MADTPNRTRGLGRGLSALMADVGPATTEASTPRRPDLSVPIEKIAPNPDQPRRRFAPEALQELAESIRTRGIIQPLIVRPNPRDASGYEIVAGERRWRAAQMAQLHQVPVIVRQFDDTEVLEVAIIENIQRADLNPVEEAAGYRQLMDRFGHTQEKLAEALGKSRSHIANILRLLTLPEPVLDHLREGRLTMGHARALITSADPLGLARKVITENLSFRDTETLVRKVEPTGKTAKKQKLSGDAKDADTRALEADLSAALRMRVEVDHAAGGEGGRLTIHYKSLDQLDDLCRALSEM